MSGRVEPREDLCGPGVRPGGAATDSGRAAGEGSFTGTVKWIGNGAEFTWQLAFRDLTGPATAAHIHVAPRGEAGPVAVPLCSPCTNGQRGMARMDVGTISAMNHGRTYVNIHTAENPDGEIRGQISIWDKMAVTLRPRPVTTRVVGTTSKTRAGFTATIRNVDRNDARKTCLWSGLPVRASRPPPASTWASGARWAG